MGKAVICKSRPLGASESTWCKALESGTGNTVAAILFDQLLSSLPVRAAVSDVLASQPLLRSQVVKRDGKRWFDIPDKILVDVDVVDKSTEEENTTGTAEEKWLQILEDEINTLYPAQNPHLCFQARLYYLPCQTSLLILRMHPAATDMVSGPQVCSQVLSSLHHYTELENRGENLEELTRKRSRVSDFPEEDVIHTELPAVEDAIPRGEAKKPFWAHGIDVVGYGLVSRRHAYLPFDTPCKPSRSRIIRSILSQTATQNLLEACKKGKTDTYGVLTAAALKAVADYKKVGSKGEHYGVVCLLNCRKLLQPQIPESTVGFYHAAMLRTIHATQKMGLWELASKCSHDFEEAVKKKKHFTDMGDLTMLMGQAIAHPNLTPAGSMRTALISACYEAAREETGEEGRALKVKDWTTGSSSHGVGSCITLFPILRDGALHLSCFYCEPLYSRTTAQALLHSIHSTLSNLE